MHCFVGYQASTVAALSLLDVTRLTFLQTAMYCVKCQTRTIAVLCNVVVEATQLTFGSKQK